MTATTIEHDKQVLDALLAAAWLKRIGPVGTPGEWAIPFELLDVGSVHGLDVEVYPTWAKLGADGTPKMWGNLGPKDRVAAWRWDIKIGWEDLTESEIDQAEDHGGCVDERSISFHALGGHQEKPSAPEGLIDLLAFLGEGPHYADEATAEKREEN